jgi:hypothetical protein
MGDIIKIIEPCNVGLIKPQQKYDRGAKVK